MIFGIIHEGSRHLCVLLCVPSRVFHLHPHRDVYHRDLQPISICRPPCASPC